VKLSIIIPARNEAPLIASTVTRLRDYLDSVNITDLEILVVNDGSSDNTFEVVLAENRQDARIRVITNIGRSGFGRAVAYGLSHFTGDAAVIYMADASDTPEDVARYYRILRDEADCAFGSRFMRGSNITGYPRFKLVINRIANFVIKTMFGLPYNDVTNAFKGYRRNVIEGCAPFVSPHFNLTIEIPLKAIVRGYSYRVTPIAWHNREIGTSSLILKEQGSRYLYTLLVVWFEWLLVRHDTHRMADDVFIAWDERETEPAVVNE
jgi:dolichol-phosphate mannosyltransferase